MHGSFRACVRVQRSLPGSSREPQSRHTAAHPQRLSCQTEALDRRKARSSQPPLPISGTPSQPSTRNGADKWRFPLRRTNRVTQGMGDGIQGTTRRRMWIKTTDAGGMQSSQHGAMFQHIPTDTTSRMAALPHGLALLTTTVLGLSTTSLVQTCIRQRTNDGPERTWGSAWSLTLRLELRRTPRLARIRTTVPCMRPPRMTAQMHAKVPTVGVHSLATARAWTAYRSGSVLTTQNPV